VEPFEKLCKLLEEEIKFMRPIHTLIKCKTTIKMCKMYIIEDNFNLSFLILSKHKDLIKDLKKFGREALKLYKKCLENMKIFHERVANKINLI
jgi:hypothetical protein